MRPKHYVKNFLIFLPVFFSGNFFETSSIFKLILGFFSFSFISSCIYIINDMRDIENDRNHPSKKNRPLASGKVSFKGATIELIILFFLTIILNFLISKSFSTMSFALLAIYFILNFFYSFGLKNYPIVDIVILSSGFILRILYGSSISNTEISNWLFLTVLAFSLYMSFGKRWGELQKSAGKVETRKVLKFYTKDFLRTNMSLCMTLGIVFYSLWAADFSKSTFVASSPMLYTVPLVLIICFTYQYTINKDSYADPIEVVFTSKPLLLLSVLYGIILLAILYFSIFVS